ncbi:hypothetical protein D1AOALGA4SA_9448 [Olavius algarvensis Delta 1 endosymbiont]|nr:hypothetical protein D1AOALGA4SA_9448 [Olavius algarvensis Delta 1 endosymbiont]
MEFAPPNQNKTLRQKNHRLPLFDISQFILLVGAIIDLTAQTRAMIAESFLTFEIWFPVVGMVMVVTITLSFSVSWMERRFKVIF